MAGCPRIGELLRFTGLRARRVGPRARCVRRGRLGLGASGRLGRHHRHRQRRSYRSRQHHDAILHCHERFPSLMSPGTNPAHFCAVNDKVSLLSEVKSCPLPQSIWSPPRYASHDGRVDPTPCDRNSTASSGKAHRGFSHDHAAELSRRVVRNFSMVGSDGLRSRGTLITLHGRVPMTPTMARGARCFRPCPAPFESCAYVRRR